MRGFLLILGFFALLGVGGGVLMLVYAMGRSYEVAGAATLPMLIGVIALVGVTVTLAVDEARKDIIARLGDR